MSRSASGGTGRPLAMSANCSQPPGSQHAADLVEHGPLVGAQVDDAVGDDDVGPAVRRPAASRRRPHGTRRGRVPERVGGLARLLQHLRGHVDADDPPGPSDLVGGDERVEARAGADVDDMLARLQTTQRERVADAGERLDGTVGQRVDEGRVVAEPRGERPAGVEVERAVRVDRDLAVLVADLLAEFVGIDGQRFASCSTPVPRSHRQAGAFPLGEPVDQPSCPDSPCGSARARRRRRTRSTGRGNRRRPRRLR